MPDQIPLNLRPDAPYNFQTFLETPSNQDALKLVKAWPNWPSPILLLLGPKGSGKTHLGRAWAQEHGGQFLDDVEGLDEAMLFDAINRVLSGADKGLMLAAKTLWQAQMPDLNSRLGAIPKAQLYEHDDDSLEPILRGLFSQTGREVSRDVVEYILKYTDRSVSALKILAGELDLAAGSAKADLTKAFVAKYLKTRS